MELEFTIPIKRPFKNIYQFKITLLDTKPSVWRRIQVPESYTFYDLHIAIQDAMGWKDSHLHCFEKRDPKARWGYLEKVDCPYAAEEIREEKLPLFTTNFSFKIFQKGERQNVLCLRLW